MARPLLIGVGNLDAGDDAAGRLVARRLRGEAEFDAVESSGVAADLLLAFEGRDRVLVVDACRTGAVPGTIHRIDAQRDQLPRGLSPTSSHGMGVVEAVRLAQALGVMPERLVIWAIELADVTPGAPLAPAVAQAVERCVDEAPAMLKRIAAGRA